jgi:heme A synthase
MSALGMRTYRLALFTLGATFLLVLAGGLVHATGSALACPDWPLCYGSAFPTMEGGVLYEHSHRLIAGTVALLTVLLAGLLVRRWTGTARAIGGLAWFAGLAQGALVGRLGVLASSSRASPASILVVAGAFAVAVVVVALWLGKRTGNVVPALGLILGEVVVVQATLGGVTVLLSLPTIVSSAHLATAMLYGVLLLALVFRLRPVERANDVLAPRGLVLGAALLVYVQIVLGAVVRHTGAALACNTEVVTCNGALLPSTGPGWLLVAHRTFAVVVAAVVVAAAWRAFKVGRQHKQLMLLAGAAVVLVLAQIVLGVLTVLSYVAMPLATAHLGGGALLLADLVTLHAALGPLRARHVAGSARGIAPLAEPQGAF